MSITPRPWKIVDAINDDTHRGYLRIEGPGGEKVCDIFPFAAEGGVSIEVARQNAMWIITLANQHKE